MRIKRLIKALFRRRKKDYVSVYLTRFNAIDKLIQAKLVGIDIKDVFVELDVQEHIRHMYSPREYAAYFDTLRGFINYHRGLHGLSMISYQDRINFSVVLKREKYWDMETEQLYDPPVKEYIPMIVGYYQEGKLKYIPYKNEEISGE